MSKGSVASQLEITCRHRGEAPRGGGGEGCLLLGRPGSGGGGSGVRCSAATMSLRKLCTRTTDSPPCRPRTPLVVGNLAAEVVPCRYADVRTDTPVLRRLDTSYYSNLARKRPRRSGNSRDYAAARRPFSPLHGVGSSDVSTCGESASTASSSRALRPVRREPVPRASRLLMFNQSAAHAGHACSEVCAAYLAGFRGALAAVLKAP